MCKGGGLQKLSLNAGISANYVIWMGIGTGRSKEKHLELARNFWCGEKISHLREGHLEAASSQDLVQVRKEELAKESAGRFLCHHRMNGDKRDFPYCAVP